VLIKCSDAIDAVGTQTRASRVNLTFWNQNQYLAGVPEGRNAHTSCYYNHLRLVVRKDVYSCIATYLIC